MEVNARNYCGLAMRTQCDQVAAHDRIGRSYRMMSLLHSVIGMMGELGELASNLEKSLWYGQPFDAVNHKEEYGDVMWYIAEGLRGLDLEMDLEEVLQKNIAKLAARYPKEFSEHLAKEENRDRQKERKILEGSVTADPLPTRLEQTIREAFSRVGIVPKNLVVTAPSIEQNGNGFGELPEESEIPAKDPTVLKSEALLLAHNIAALLEGRMHDMALRMIDQFASRK